MTSTSRHQLIRPRDRRIRQWLANTAGGLATALLSALSTTPLASANPPERCYADWSQAAEIVRAQALVTAKDVHERARTGRIGDVVRMTLCEDNGRFIYRLVVREEKGQVVKLIVDARQPF